MAGLESAQLHINRVNANIQTNREQDRQQDTQQNRRGRPRREPKYGRRGSKGYGPQKGGGGGDKGGK